MVPSFAKLGAYFSFPGYFLLERKLKQRETFKALVRRAGGFTPAAIDTYHADKGKKDLLEALGALKQFIEAV